MNKNINNWQDDPRISRWLTAFDKSTPQPDPLDPDQIILNGSEADLPEDLPNDTFQRAFTRTMRHAVTVDEEGQPRFFKPRTFLQNTHRRVFYSRAHHRDFASGISCIIQVKNLPEHKENPAVQQAAQIAVEEYLDPELLAGNFSLDSELNEIYALLNPKSRQDQMLNQCFIDADHRRKELIEQRDRAIYQRAEDEYLEQKERDRKELDRYEALRLLQYAPNDTPVARVQDLLKESPDRVAFERINALKLWRDFIQENIPDAKLTEGVRSFQPEPHIPSRPDLPESDTYSVIAFNYAGHRCMIAECCNEHPRQSSSAAMKVWRGELDDPNGWEQAFTQTKKVAAQQDLCKDIRHTNLTAEVESRKTDNYQHIVESEDKLFQIAFRYFETGEPPRNDEATSTELDEFVGPRFRRPNPAA